MQRVVIALLAFFLLQASCVSEKKYMALEADYTVQQAQTQARDRKIEAVEASLQKAEAENRRYTAEIATLQEQLQKSAERNRKLTEHLTTAEQELQKKASIIQLQEQVIRRTDATRRQIESELQEQIEKQEIKLEEMQGRLKVTFIDKILFNTGSAVINSRGRAVLRKVAASLGKHSGQTILVEGHTDNVAIGPVLREKFPTNWELSTARATAVVRFLQDEAGLAPERLSACGYSFYKPAAGNGTEEERSQNRRIEVILTPVSQR